MTDDDATTSCGPGCAPPTRRPPSRPPTRTGSPDSWRTSWPSAPTTRTDARGPTRRRTGRHRRRTDDLAPRAAHLAGRRRRGAAHRRRRGVRAGPRRRRRRGRRRAGRGAGRLAVDDRHHHRAHRARGARHGPLHAAERPHACAARTSPSTPRSPTIDRRRGDARRRRTFYAGDADRRGRSCAPRRRSCSALVGAVHFRGGRALPGLRHRRRGQRVRLQRALSQPLAALYAEAFGS